MLFTVARVTGPVTTATSPEVAGTTVEVATAVEAGAVNRFKIALEVSSGRKPPSNPESSRRNHPLSSVSVCLVSPAKTGA